MTFWLTIAAAIAISGASAATGWTVRSWKAAADDQDRLEAQMKANLRQAEKVDTKANQFAKGEAAAQARERLVVKEVIRVVQKPFYAASAPACLDDDGLRILTADIDASNARRQLAPAVRAASGAGG